MWLFRTLLMGVLWGAMAAHAKAAGAPDQAEQVLRAWITAFNNADREALTAFRAQYQMRPDAQGDLEFRADTGGLQVLDVTESTPDKAQLLVLPRANDRTMLVTATLDPVKQSAAFQFEGAETPARFKPKRMETAAVLAEAKQRLDALVASDALAGTFLAATKGTVQMEWHGGLADRENATPVRLDTQFRLASVNKMFTAVAILQLQESGKLSLDDAVATYLPDYPAPQHLRGVTLRQLLSHTSGLGDIFGEKADAHAGSLKTLRDYWAVFADEPPAFTPGSKDQYSNYGFILLGTVIEAVSGQSYYDYVEAHIFRVAGMTATGSAPESSQVPGLAKAYTKVDGQWRHETASLPWRGTSAGGGYSTVGDLLKFGEALRSGTLVAPATLAAATSPQNHKAWYGYGFMVRGQGKERVYGHEGGAQGANAVFYILPEQGVVLVGLANVDPDAMGNVVNYVANRLPL